MRREFDKLKAFGFFLGYALSMHIISHFFPLKTLLDLFITLNLGLIGTIIAGHLK